ncbi:MAG TPA: cyanase [Pseudonocardiaceae bacterium]
MPTSRPIGRSSASPGRPDRAAGVDQALDPTQPACRPNGGQRRSVRCRPDPTIYRFYEVIQVYGPAIKELIHEKFGDGIMSAINFKIDVDRREDPGGERVVVTLDGKFLKYQWG